MVNELMRYLIQVADFSVTMFEWIIEATGARDLYLGAVFITFSFGFLMYAFRNGLHTGLDRGSDKAANAYKAKSSRPYRLGQDKKIPH